MPTPPTRTTRAAALRRALVAGAAAGAGTGALLLGAAVAFLHALHDPALGAADAAVLTLWCFALYGAAGAAMAGAVAALLAVLRPATPPATLATAGVAAFLAACATVVAVYGFTYGDLPTEALANRWGMLAWLAVRAGFATFVAAVVALVVRGVARRLGLGWRGAAAVALLVVVAVAASAALVRRAATPAPPLAEPIGAGPGRPVVLLGFDGADWQVLDALIAAGEMPHLARLVARGVRASLYTLPDANSAVIWASIYSGRPPAVHRVDDFYRLRLAGMGAGVFPVHQTGLKEMARRLQGFGLAGVRPIDRTDVDAPLLWEIAARAGRTVGLVDGYYYSYPAPDLGPANRFYLAYGADRWASRHRRRAAALADDPEAPAYVRPPALIAAVADTVALPELEWQTETLLRLLEGGEQPDLVTLYTHQPDGVQHWEWRDFQPELYFRGGDGEHKIAVIHRQIDDFLGRLLPLLDPRTVVVFASDHGHSPTLVHAMDTQHRYGPPGVLVMAGDGIVPGELQDAHVYDLMPTLLILLGLPVADDMPGRVLRRALAAEIADSGTIRSYQSLPPPELSAGPRDAAQEAEELEKLKALGYLR